MYLDEHEQPDPLHYDPRAAKHWQETISLHVPDSTETVTLRALASHTPDVPWIGGLFWTEHGGYLGMLAPQLADDSIPTTHHHVTGWDITIDRLTSRHTTFGDALAHLADHAARLAPGLRALETMLRGYSTPQRDALRYALTQLANHDDPDRQQRWARHVRRLCTRDRIDHDPLRA